MATLTTAPGERSTNERTRDVENPTQHAILAVKGLQSRTDAEELRCKRSLTPLTESRSLKRPKLGNGEYVERQGEQHDHRESVAADVGSERMAAIQRVENDANDEVERENHRDDRNMLHTNNHLQSGGDRGHDAAVGMGFDNVLDEESDNQGGGGGSQRAAKQINEDDTKGATAHQGGGERGQQQHEPEEEEEPDWDAISCHGPAKKDVPLFLSARERRLASERRFADSLDECHATLSRSIDTIFSVAAEIYDNRREELLSMEDGLKADFVRNEEVRADMQRALRESAVAAQGLFADLLMRVSQSAMGSPALTARSNIGQIGAGTSN